MRAQCQIEELCRDPKAEIATFTGELVGEEAHDPEVRELRAPLRVERCRLRAAEAPPNDPTRGRLAQPSSWIWILYPALVIAAMAARARAAPSRALAGSKLWISPAFSFAIRGVMPAASSAIAFTRRT